MQKRQLEYLSVSRTLCPSPVANDSIEQQFFLGISTSEYNNTAFDAVVNYVDDFVIGYALLLLQFASAFDSTLNIHLKDWRRTQRQRFGIGTEIF